MHLLNLKELSVGLVSITDIVLIEGNLIEMIIKAQGCHEIVINGVKKLEGDCRRVIFKAKNLDRPFNIFFYGCFRSITYTIWLKGYRVTLSNNTAAARVPDLSRMQKLPGKPIILRLTGTFALRSGQMKLSVFDSTRMKESNLKIMERDYYKTPKSNSRNAIFLECCGW